MKFAKLQEYITQNNGNLTEHKFNLDVSTNTDVDELITILSNESLTFADLTIRIDKQVSDYFISKFSEMTTMPKITKLSLPNIELRHYSWTQFFGKLKDLTSLRELGLDNSNFHSVNDFKPLGDYLARNPELLALDISSNVYLEKPPFQTGDYEVAMRECLAKNTHLMKFSYGMLGLGSVSEAIRNKLDINKNNLYQKNRVPEAVTKLSDEQYIKGLINELDKFLLEAIKDSLNSVKEGNQFFSNKIIDARLGRIQFESFITSFKNSYDDAKEDEAFKQSERATHIQTLGKYYAGQRGLLQALDALSEREEKASDHDKPILHNLREDFLKQWQKALSVTEPTERKEALTHTLVEMTQACEQAAGEVKDAESGAFLKNVILAISIVFTLGLALGIYAVLPKDFRAPIDNYFFNNKKLSKDAVEYVKDRLDVATKNLK